MDLEIKDVYEDLRPYRDGEIPAAMRRIADYGMLKDICDYTFPDISLDEIREAILSSATSDEFQVAFGLPLLKRIIDTTMSAFTYGGVSNIDRSKGHLYMSNHRDIVLDGALLQYVLYDNGITTTEITFGSNLISPGFIEDFGRSNKMFKIVRGGSNRDLIQNSQILSAHLHEVVNEDKSIWISQRDGRTKDGNDRTDQGLVKMLAMGGTDLNVFESLSRLNIIPFAISYEYESCDSLKAREIYISRRGTYTKQPGEDLKSILTGVQQYKGEVHLELCEPITGAEISGLEGENNNETLRNMASLIDRRIISAYKLYGTNYIAYDIRKGTSEFSGKYTTGQREEFTAYLKKQASAIEGDQDEIFDILLDIYATPVVNKLEIA